MTLQELLDKIQSGIRAGRLDPDMNVKMRDARVDDAMADAGSAQWIDIDEALIVEGELFLNTYEVDY